MSLIELEAALEICEKEYQERLRMLDYCGDTVAWNIGGAIKDLPTIDPIRAAGGCRCGECKKHMTPKCLLCSFDVDGSCTGGPESNFYCGDSEPREAQNDG